MENSDKNIATDFQKKVSEEVARQLSIFLQTAQREPGMVVPLIKFKDEYIKFMKDKGFSPSYVRNSDWLLIKMSEFFGPSTTLADIDLKRAEDFILYLEKTAKFGVQNYLRTVKAIWNKAQKWKYIKENPFTEIKLLRRQKKESEYLTIADIQQICDNVKSKTIRDIIWCSCFSGGRLSEILTLTWKDIDIENRLIHFGRTHITKSRKERVVPIVDPLWKILEVREKKIHTEYGFIFKQRNGRPYTSDRPSKTFKKGVRCTNLPPGTHFHQLRGAFSSYLINNGANIYHLQKLLGHQSISTTQVYLSAKLDDLRTAVSCFNT